MVLESCCKLLSSSTSVDDYENCRMQTADVSVDEVGCYELAIVEWMVDIAMGIDAGVMVSALETKLLN